MARKNKKDKENKEKAPAAAQELVNDSALMEEDLTVVLRTEEEIPAPLSMNMGVSSILGTRKNQQDSVFGQVEGNRTIAVVCDGMGGMNGGEMASQTAVKILVEDYYKKMPENDIPAFFREEAYKMNTAVRELENENGDRLNGGTTVVAAIIEGNRLYWLSVGDSKIYLIRGSDIVAVNQEHNLKLRIDEQLRTGEITEEEYQKEAEQAEALISFLGIEELTLMDINEKPFLLQENDIVLLCSDGLYKCMSPKEIAETVFYEEPDMERAAKRLTEVVTRKNRRSQDNTSLVIMQYSKY